jgi:hypothetical protein
MDERASISAVMCGLWSCGLLWLREEESEVSMHRTTRMWFGVAAVSALVLT